IAVALGLFLSEQMQAAIGRRTAKVAQARQQSCLLHRLLPEVEFDQCVSQLKALLVISQRQKCSQIHERFAGGWIASFAHHVSAQINGRRVRWIAAAVYLRGYVMCK